MHSPKGNSLIEVMLVLLITLVTAGSAVLVSREDHHRRTLRADAQSVRRFLEDALLRALHERVASFIKWNQHSIIITPDSGSPRLLRLDPPTHLVERKSNVPLRMYGTGVTSPITISLARGDARCTVTLSLRGRVSTSC
jgi:hypothetical protein